MDDRLSVDDARILALESEAIRGHTMKLIVLEPASAPVDLEALRAAVDVRLPPGSRGRDRVELEPEPRWVAEEPFDLAAHVRRVEGTEGTDEAGMREAAATLMSQRLHHRRALWSFDLVGPLADGREAIVCRIHHAMADGVSCVRFLDEVLWDQAPAPAAAPRRPAASAAPPARRRARSSPSFPARCAASSATAPRRPSSTVRSAPGASSPSPAPGSRS